MDLSAYLRRVGYAGPTVPRLSTLRALHRAHLRSVPYENLDIHLGRRLELDPRRAFEKVVREGRGGWCFEMNGLFAWALAELGFDVELIAGAVNRPAPGSAADFDHLALKVTLDRPYLADVGFGHGFLEPLPLEVGERAQGFLDYRLERDGSAWTFRNHRFAGNGFGFTLEPRALGEFAAQNEALQTSPDSGFVRLTVCHRFTDRGGLVSLRGATLRTVTARGEASRALGSLEEYERALDEGFGLRLERPSELWARVREGHLAWVAAGGRV